MTTGFASAVLFALAAAVLPAAAPRAAEPRDTVFTASFDGSEQRYVLLMPETFDPDAESHLLVALHGHGSDRWQYATGDRGETAGAREVAARYGMIMVCPDYRAKTSWMGPAAEADVVQIIAEMRKKHRIAKVFLVGGSMGASSALTFAALHPDLVAGVSAQNPTANHLEYRNFQDAIRASFGGTKEQIPLEYKKRSAEYWPEAFTMPVAITVGGRDTSVPPQSAIRLAGVLREMNRKVLLINREETGHTTSREDTVAALEFVVRAALGLAPAPPPAEPVRAAQPPAAPPATPAAAGGGTFFAGSAPALADAKGTVELGMAFEIAKPGALTAFWFYKGHGETGDARPLRLWAADGTLLLEAKTENESAQGWQRAVLGKPFPVKAGETYTVSYTVAARYPGTAGAFAKPIVRDGIAALRGVYNFSDLGKKMPVLTYQNMSYWVDVDYRPD